MTILKQHLTRFAAATLILPALAAGLLGFGLSASAHTSSNAPQRLACDTVPVCGAPIRMVQSAQLHLTMQFDAHRS